ncbi:hypothetical protein TrCOL_g7832 [Triparma columacea]|uniref:Uncharacterized protein n=1 Tax=Triparma columacea TaxID=722753 RepID=A0A9W7G8J2_9STRA|nr:hypothetical protein TrCOL_g7832 [Triparma columacea]
MAETGVKTKNGFARSACPSVGCATRNFGSAMMNAVGAGARTTTRNNLSKRRRKIKDESAKMTILSCPCCGVVGFGGIDGGDGTEPVLALKTDEHDFDLGEGWSLDCEVVEERIQHLDGCPKASGGAKRGLEKLVASISFDRQSTSIAPSRTGDSGLLCG